MLVQRTLKRMVNMKGTGLHSGQPVTVQLVPAPAGNGIVFQRTDLEGQPVIPAAYDRVVDTRLCTTLGMGEVRVATIEHLMSALYGVGVDNVQVRVDGPEIPILDGSSQPWIQAILEAGTRRQQRCRRLMVVRRAVTVRDGDAWARFEPSSRFRISARVDYDHPLISRHLFTFDFSELDFVQKIASARTFAFKREVEALRSMGLALGGSLDNAIVVDDFSILNPDGLRFVDEFVRHKVLDAIGDVALAGEKLVGHLVLHRSGHALNNQLLHAVFADARNYRLVSTERQSALPAHGVELPETQTGLPTAVGA